jgi:hypothetical protein
MPQRNNADYRLWNAASMVLQIHERPAMCMFSEETALAILRNAQDALLADARNQNTLGQVRQLARAPSLLATCIKAAALLAAFRVHLAEGPTAEYTDFTAELDAAINQAKGT